MLPDSSSPPRVFVNRLNATTTVRMTSNDDQFKSITGDNGTDEILSSVKMRLCETKRLNPFVPQHLRRTDTMQIFCRRLIPWRMQIVSSTIWIRIESITLSRSIFDKDVVDGRDVNLHLRKRTRRNNSHLRIHLKAMRQTGPGYHHRHQAASP